MNTPDQSSTRPPARPAAQPSLDIEPKPGPPSPAAPSSTILTADRPDPGAPSSPEWFDSIYRTASGDSAGVPWAKLKPNPFLLAWLNAEAAARVRPGSRAIVVGCGLGDDVAELISRGYDVTGFDISPTAIDWARKRFPADSHAFIHADLFNLPTRFRHRFELVVEISTLQALLPAQREAASLAIANLCGPRGVVLTICRARDDDSPLDHSAPPPYPICPAELSALMEAAGLKPCRAFDDFMDDETPPVRRLRALFERA